MRVGVLGGTGTAGTATVAELRRRGHGVRVLGRHAEGAGRIDICTGEGLPAALADVDALVDTVNSRSPRPKDAAPVLLNGVQRALAAARDAGVAHVVSLSIVGADRVPLGYYRVKTAQEGVVRSAGLPWTIVRSTQFHGLVAAFFAATARFGVLAAPRVVLQPVAPRDVAVALADAVDARHPGATHEIAGPEIAPLGQLAATYRAQRAPHRPIIAVPAIGGVLRAMAIGGLTSKSARRGQTTFAVWLGETG